MSESADDVVGLYQRHAAAFDMQRDRTLIERAWLDRFLGLADPHANLLDIGCGMGEPIAAYLIERGRAITGIYSAPSLIALARERFPTQSWIIADMRALTLGKGFGGLIAWHSFFHLSAEAQRTMIPIFAAYALPGAPLMFTSGTEAGTAIGSFEGEPLHHASLDPQDYRTLLDVNGFDVIDYVTDDATCGHANIWLARFRGG